MLENEFPRKLSREKMAEVFLDTQDFYTTNPVLANAIQTSIEHTRFYDENELPNISSESSAKGEIQVTVNRTFEAAVKLHSEFPDKKICVLNFASATNPGGGVVTGARAQEESLCRCSTLYPTLNREELWKKYYSVNRSRYNNLYTNACIYSPNIIICKSDEAYPVRLPENKWVTVDVITCAAPDLRHGSSCGSDSIYNLHIKRAEHIVSAAIDNQAKILVLGAFGCGAFRNDPYVVARAYKNVLDRFRTYFERIEFAIFTAGNESLNYTVFSEMFTN